MNKKGNTDIEQIIGGIFILVVFIPLLLTVLSMIRTDQCSDYQKQIDSLNNQLNQLNAELQETKSTAEFWKFQYDNLTTTEVTKQDFIEIKSNVNVLLNQINNTKNQVYNINQQIINIKNIKNIYFALSFVLSLSFSLFGFAIIDFTFFKLALSKKILQKLYFIRNKTEIKIKEESKDDE